MGRGRRVDVIKISNLLYQEDVNSLVRNFKDSPENNESFYISEELGRYHFGIKNVNENIKIKLTDIAQSMLDFKCEFSGAAGVEYNPRYGDPKLPPHFDGDFSDLIINYQLESNTEWGLGVDLNLYDIEDNSALIFHPNKNIHWRPKKTFKEGEFIRLVFFRFYNAEKLSDYSHLRQHWPHHEIFSDVNKFIDSVSE